MLTGGRGASGSAGRTSWSGKPELSDYVSIYGFMLHYINGVFQSDLGRVLNSQETPTLVLGGYSYGSMIASHLPSRKFVVDLFDSAAPDSAESEVKRRAVDLSCDARAFLEMHLTPAAATMTTSSSRRDKERSRKPTSDVVMGGYESSRISRENSRKSVDAERIKQSLDKVRRKIGPNQPNYPSNVSSAPATEPTTPPAECAPTVLPGIAYLIVSPILSTAAGFTTMFSKLRFTSKGRQVAPTTEEYHELTVNPCGCIYGNKDGFTSARRLQRWTEELKSRPGSQFMAIEADGGHFWHEAAGIVRLKQGVAEFVEGLTRRYTVCQERPSSNKGTARGTSAELAESASEQMNVSNSAL